MFNYFDNGKYGIIRNKGIYSIIEIIVNIQVQE